MQQLSHSRPSVRLSVLLVTASALSGPAITLGEDVRAPQPTPRQPSPRPSGGPGAICTATLTVRQTAGASGCFIDERVTGAPGVLRYPCDGGAATAAFSTATFAGTVTDGVVELRLVTSFDFNDRCHWQSAQTIRGTLASHQLAFTYNEAPVAGQRNCARPCAATATVLVAP